MSGNTTKRSLIAKSGFVLLPALNRLSEADRTWFDYLLAVLDRPCCGHERFYVPANLIQRFGPYAPERLSRQFGELLAAFAGQSDYPKMMAMPWNLIFGIGF